MRSGVTTARVDRARFLRDEKLQRIIAAVFTVIFIIVANTLVGGCAIKLAPDFDKAIFDGLTKANEDAMKLFASTSTRPFSKRAKAYDDVVGELNAVQVQIKARATPSAPSLLLRIPGVSGNKMTQQEISDALVPPTAADVDTLVKIMITAKNEDQKGRLKGRIDFLMEAYAIQMAQALAYEKALIR